MGGAEFVGRDAELSRLMGRFERARGGSGGLAMLVGEAGIGKTATTHEVARLARASGARVLRGACYEGGASPPLAPWVHALGEYARQVEPAELVRVAGAGAPALAGLVAELAFAAETLAPLGPREERHRLHDAVIQLLLRAAAEPLVVIVEDLHWADADSLDLFRHLARFAARSRLFLLGTWREPELGGPSLPDVAVALRREADCLEIPLHGFSVEETARFLAVSSGEAVPPALVRAIVAETSGNPFYTREVFLCLVEEQKLVRRPGSWSTDFSLLELHIPESVRHVVELRVSRLLPETAGVLRVAAGFTGDIAFRVLLGTAELDENRLLDAIDQAIAAGLLVSTPGGSYQFTHAIVRRAIYDGLNPDRRARIHRRIAEALEALGGDGDPGELAAQYHASAGLPGRERGVEPALVAAEKAAAAAAHERAVAFLLLARELARELPQPRRAEVARRLALAQADALQLEAAALTAREAVLLSDGDISDFLIRCARSLREGGAPRAAWEPLVDRGLALVEGRRDLTWARLRLLCDCVEPVVSGPAYIAVWRGFDAEAVAIARAQGDESDWAATLEPYEPRSREETEAALRQARTWKGASTLRALDAITRDHLFRHGDYREVIERLNELRTLAERLGSIAGQATALTQLVIVYAALGEFARAQEGEARAREVSSRLGGMHRLQLIGLAGMRLIVGYFVGGTDWSELAQGCCRAAQHPETGTTPLGLVSTCLSVFSLVMAGKEAEARHLLLPLVSALEKTSPSVYQHQAARDCAAIAVWELRAVELAGRIRRLPAPPGAGQAPFSLPELSLGRMAALEGDLEAASGAFARARVTATARGLRPLLALADWDESVALGEGDRAARLRASALQQFTALGMTRWSERASRQPPDGLTLREVEVLKLVAAGQSNKEIAASLFISVSTVEHHIANVYDKIGVRGRANATAYALRHRL